MTKIKDPGVLANLLLNAYFAEETEKDVIAETLYWIREKTPWDVLFQLYCDNEIHKKMLLEAVERLGYKSEFEAKGKVFDFKGKSKEEMMQSISNWEYFAFHYYSYLLKMVDFEGLKELIDAEDVEEVRGTLESLVEWETKHIEMLKRFFKSSLLFRFGDRTDE
jgi:hypothetical protein